MFELYRGEKRLGFSSSRRKMRNFIYTRCGFPHWDDPKTLRVRLNSGDYKPAQEFYNTKA